MQHAATGGLCIILCWCATSQSNMDAVPLYFTLFTADRVAFRLAAQQSLPQLFGHSGLRHSLREQCAYLGRQIWQKKHMTYDLSTNMFPSNEGKGEARYIQI